MDSLRVVDAHHHLWELATGGYPWLQGTPEDPSDSSGLGMLQRDYLARDYLEDARGISLQASVHIEAAHDPADPMQETTWLQGQHDSTGFPSVVVFGARLESTRLADHLAQECERGFVRGVRQMLDRNPATGLQEETALIDNRQWRRGMGMLAPLGLSFDLQVLPSQLGLAAALAADFADTVFIVNHGGYHVRHSPAMFELWRRGIAELAHRPNVFVKASGYEAVDPLWTPTGYDCYVRTLLDVFGVDRVMFGTNFPVDKRTISLRGLIASALRATVSLTARERDLFFFGNAMRIYRIGRR